MRLVGILSLSIRPKRAATQRQLPPATWRYTDDTQMALSIYENLRRFGEINPTKLAESFSKHFDISRGYGLGAEQLLLDIKDGGDWQILAPAMFDGTGSFGNGSAMRVAPIGAYFSGDMETVIEHARQSSIVTHTHADAISGAIVVAVAAAQVYQFSSFENKPQPEIYWAAIMDAIPNGQLKQAVEKAANIDKDTSTEDAAKLLGCGWDISAIDTVPFALWCAITYLDDFEEALWQTISVGGDTDTTGAIVGGIVASFGGQECITKDWLDKREELPHWALDLE